MTASTSPKVKDQELMSFGLFESVSVNSFSDFVQSDSRETVRNAEKANNDFINIFICHLIFYSVFCISLVMHILIDLGLGSFLKNLFSQFIEFSKNPFVEKKTVFA